MAAMAPAWFWRKVHQLCEGRRLDLGRYFRIAAEEAARPSLASSSRMRGLASRIDGPHPANQLNQLGILSGASTGMPELTSPQHPEPDSLPADNGLGLKNHQRGTPVWPPSFQNDL